MLKSPRRALSNSQRDPPGERARSSTGGRADPRRPDPRQVSGSRCVVSGCGRIAKFATAPDPHLVERCPAGTVEYGLQTLLVGAKTPGQPSRRRRTSCADRRRGAVRESPRPAGVASRPLPQLLGMALAVGDAVRRLLRGRQQRATGTCRRSRRCAGCRRRPRPRARVRRTPQRGPPKGRAAPRRVRSIAPHLAAARRPPRPELRRVARMETREPAAVVNGCVCRLSQSAILALSPHGGRARSDHPRASPVVILRARPKAG